MKVPFLDLRAQYLELREEIDAALLAVLDSGWYVLGHKCEEFELAFKNYLVADAEGYVVGVNSGTDALKLSLLAAGVGPDDEVITVANSAIPTATAICSIGAAPVFCDVDHRTWLLDPSQLEAHVTSRTRAIVPVHLYGGSCDMDAILVVARKFELQVIEDVAQATGSLYKGNKCGTIGNFGAFSFYPSKNLGAYGDGGAIYVNSSDKRDLLRMLRNYGQVSRYRAEIPRGENSRLDEIQASLLTVKLRHLERWNEVRRKRVLLYEHYFEELGIGLICQKEVDESSSARHLFVVKLRPNQRDRVIQLMELKGVQTLIHYPHTLYDQPAFRKYKREVNTEAEKLCRSVISIPFHQYLTQDEIRYVAESLAEVLMETTPDPFDENTAD